MKSGPTAADLLWARRPPSRDQKKCGSERGRHRRRRNQNRNDQRRRRIPSAERDAANNRPARSPRRPKKERSWRGLGTRDPTGTRKGDGRRRRGGRPRLADGTNGCRDDVLEQGTAWSSEEEVFGYGRTGAASEAAPKPPAEDAASGEKQQGSNGAGGARDAPSAEPAPLAGRMPK